MHVKLWLLLGLALTLLAAFTARAGGPLDYPDTKRVDHTDVYKGPGGDVTVADPYRWLEEDVRKSPEVKEWVEAENKVTNAYLATIPQRDAIKKRLTELWDYERYTAPAQRGGLYFYTRNDGLQNQDVLYVQQGLRGQPRQLLDPNTWSKDGTVSLAGVAVSPKGKHLAYGKSESGSDWTTWHVLDVATGKKLDDELKWTKFSGASWARDGKGFFYSRYPEPKEGEKFQGLVFNPKIYYHEVGTPQADDKLVFATPDHPDWGFQTSVTDDGEYLVITVWKGTDDRYRVLYRDLKQQDAEPKYLIDNFENRYDFVGNDGPVFYFVTDYQAPKGRLIAIDTRQPAQKDWREVIPESENALEGVSYIGGKFIANYLKDARTQVLVYGKGGKLTGEIDLPTIGTASGFGGEQDDTETFYTFYGWATPPRIYRYDVPTGKSELWREPEVPFRPDDYETKQIFYKSKDGTRVPMFLTARRGTKVGPGTPTLLYGYGGFNIPVTPRFSPATVAWMEMGGVYAVANIRGGGEYGKDWHQAAVKLNRPKAYEDFIAAAEWLIDNGHTSKEKLAIQGRSNGGLLVGAVMCRRPDLFGACLPGVGVMDMLRFHKFTAGRYWVDDYGSSDSPEEFAVLYSYSPYHNLKKGVRYPATLVTTADTDDRVVPSHSFKFIARLQYCQGGDAPVLARIETRAGHGAGRATTQIIEEYADEWAFLVKNLDMSVSLK